MEDVPPTHTVGGADMGKVVVLEGAEYWVCVHGGKGGLEWIVVTAGRLKSRGVLNGKEKSGPVPVFPQKPAGTLCAQPWLVAVGGWRLAVGSWQMAVGGGWWLAVGGWGQLAVVGSWRLVAAGGWWRLVAVGGWRWVAVGT